MEEVAILSNAQEPETQGTPAFRWGSEIIFFGERRDIDTASLEDHNPQDSL